MGADRFGTWGVILLRPKTPVDADQIVDGSWKKCVGQFLRKRARPRFRQAQSAIVVVVFATIFLPFRLHDSSTKPSTKCSESDSTICDFVHDFSTIFFYLKFWAEKKSWGDSNRGQIVEGVVVQIVGKSWTESRGNRGEKKSSKKIVPIGSPGPRVKHVSEKPP
jgi:hypothetical protein